MRVKIKETGEIKTLECWIGNPAQDSAAEIYCNSGDTTLTWDANEEIYIGNNESVAWWEDYFRECEADDDAWVELDAELREAYSDDPSKYEEAVGEYNAAMADVANDYPRHHEVAVATMRRIRGDYLLSGNADKYGGPYEADDGIRVYLTQPPYISGTRDDCYYQAAGIGDDGNRYLVFWDTRDDFDPSDDDEGYACDWDAPCEITRA